MVFINYVKATSPLDLKQQARFAFIAPLRLSVPAINYVKKIEIENLPLQEIRELKLRQWIN